MLEDQQSPQLQQASSITPQVLHTKTMQKQSLPHLRALLAGGAYGTHVTKRKRWGGGKATTAANDDYGPAQALANVLQQWQPNTIANAQTNKRFKKSQTKQSNLREQLLSVLTTNAQSTSDQEIVSKISHILQPYLGKNAGYDDSNDHEHHYDDTGQQSYYAHSNSSKQHHVTHISQAGKQKTRWNKSDQFQKKHNASSPAIKGLIASEWTQVPKILESQELMRKIRAGESDDTTNIAPVNSIAEAKQLVSSWKAFGSQGGYTLLLTGPAKSMPGATPARIRVLRNNAIFKVEEVALFALGDANQAMWIKPTITVQPQTLPKIDRVTVRIAAPEEFRQHFIDGKDKPRLIVAEVAQWSPDVKASALIGGNWAENTYNKKQLLTGFLNLPTSLAKLLVAKSGTRGIFANIQDKIPTRRAITWLTRQPSETTDAYLNRCLKIAKERQEGLYYRKSSTIHTLGLSQTTEEAAKKKSQQYIARGVPRSWHMEEIQQLLESLSWTEVADFHKVKYKPEWRLKAIAPMADKDAYHYKISDSETISLIVAPTAPKLADYMRPVRNTWQGSNPIAKPVKANEGLSEPESKAGSKRDRSRSPVKVTQLDTQSQEDADQDMRTPVATSSMPHKQSYYCSPSSIPLNPDEALAQQWTLQDLGGNGDCFYRACAGARAVAKNDRTLTSDDRS